MDIIIATRNPTKTLQIKAMFAELPVSILTLEEAGIEGEAVEDGATLEENASKKAHFAAQHSGKWGVADDTGLFIDGLNGEPGVYSARWAGEGKSTEEIMHFALERMQNLPEGKRTGTFKTVAVVVSPEGEEFAFVGEVPGRMLVAPRGDPQPKMPYSALFVPYGQPKVWAEMSVEEENRISHRGKAFKKVVEFFKTKI